VEVLLTARDAQGHEASIVFRLELGVPGAGEPPATAVAGAPGTTAPAVADAVSGLGTGISLGRPGEAQKLVDAGVLGTTSDLDGFGLKGIPAQDFGLRSSDLASSDRGFPVVRIAQDGAALTVLSANGESSLFVYRGIQNAHGGDEYAVPKDAFAHTDPSAIVRLEARMSDGGALPTWIEFDPISGAFRGISPTGGAITLDLVIFARDDLGHEASIQFRLEFGVPQDDAPAEKRVQSEEQYILGRGDKPAEKQSEKDKAAEKGGVKDPARAKATVEKQQTKRGAASFSDQIKASKASKDPVLAKILDKNKPVKGSRL
jgi:hypothetical protein